MQNDQSRTTDKAEPEQPASSSPHPGERRLEQSRRDGDSYTTDTTLSDIPCATLMIGSVEFVSQSDGSILIVSDPRNRYSRVEEMQAEQLSIWLSNHLRMAEMRKR